jgi:hypothetical protein
MVEFFGGRVERAHLLGIRGRWGSVWEMVECMVRHHERALVKGAEMRAEAVWKEGRSVAEWRAEEERRVELARVKREMWEERTRRYRERKGRGSPLRRVVCVVEES